MISVRRLRWDAWNVARHQVVPEEVEEVCRGDPLVQQTYKRRLTLIGPTAVGRTLAVVLVPLGRGEYYPVTARPASRKERTIYQQQKRGRQP
jgi:uncharacterized DUF497 family protein